MVCKQLGSWIVCYTNGDEPRSKRTKKGGKRMKKSGKSKPRSSAKPCRQCSQLTIHKGTVTVKFLGPNFVGQATYTPSKTKARDRDSDCRNRAQKLSQIVYWGCVLNGGLEAECLAEQVAAFEQVYQECLRT
jgi:hypothetical protein